MSNIDPVKLLERKCITPMYFVDSRTISVAQILREISSKDLSNIKKGFKKSGQILFNRVNIESNPMPLTSVLSPEGRGSNLTPLYPEGRGIG
jgi:hypothetical protein